MATAKPKLPGLLVVLSGPAGVGKTTVASKLLERPHYLRSISATTRPPRAGEVNGKDYHFVSVAEFERLRRQNELIESAEVFGRHYGTPKQPLREAIAKNQVMLLVIDVEGGKQVKAKKLDALLVFLTAPGTAELQRRLAQRGTEDVQQQTERLSRAELELREAQAEYDRIVTNDDLERCVNEVAELIEARRAQLLARRNAGESLYPGLVKG